MISIDLGGLENLQRHLQEAMAALQQLDGEIATLKIDPNDPDAEAKAIREMAAAVDAKVAPYRGNDLVDGLADVVPSHWHDTAEYQSTGLAHLRGVCICDRKVPCTLHNLPFKHIKLVDDRDVMCAGNLRKAIRLCKHVKADAIEEGTEIGLPSFDIAAIMYHADAQALRAGSYYELEVLAETQRWLDALARNMEHASTLLVPDGGRRILDTVEKANGLVKLSIEIDDLAREVAKEQDWMLGLGGEPSLNAARQALRKRQIS